jgi:hypothetical protein
LSGSVIIFSALSGFAGGVWFSNYKRISESPLFSALEDIGVTVTVDGINCESKAQYGLFDMESKSIALCITPHDEAQSESIISTLRHEAFHVLQACYNSKELKYDKNGKVINKGLPNGSGTFFTDAEYEDYFKSKGAKDYLGDEIYERVIADYPKEQEKPELEARSAEIFFGDQQISWWLNGYCRSPKDG